MSASAPVQSYIRQYVYTAAANKISVEFAWGGDVNRMQLRCHKCGAIWRTRTPTDANTIPYEFQMWVADHGFGGTHGAEDLKDPTAPKSLLSNLGGGAIDENHAKAELIKSQIKKYKDELAAVDIDKKIAFLQQKEKEYNERQRTEAVPSVDSTPVTKLKKAKIPLGRRFR